MVTGSQRELRWLSRSRSEREQSTPTKIPPTDLQLQAGYEKGFTPRTIVARTAVIQVVSCRLRIHEHTTYGIQGRRSEHVAVQAQRISNANVAKTSKWNVTSSATFTVPKAVL